MASQFSSLIKSINSQTTKLQPQKTQINIKMEFPIHQKNTNKKPKFLCLHGFRTSGEILKKQLGKWPETVLERLELEFLDAPCLATGKSDVERLYKPPYYQWFQSNQGYTEYYHFEESVAYIEDYMIKHGPFDGLLGFSQGGILSAALLGMQMQGVALTKVPKIKFVIIASGIKIIGVKFGKPTLAANAYSSRFTCPSLHMLGEKDYLNERGMQLLELFEDPFVIRHQEGHSVPKLEGENLETMFKFIEKIEKVLLQENSVSASL